MQLAARTPPGVPRLARVGLFRVLAEASRLQVLALCAEEELSVSELAVLLDDSQPQVSRKVSALREAGLLDARRDGTRTFLKVAADSKSDAVVADALAEGRRLCLADGSLARIPKVVAGREDVGLTHFEAPATTATTSVPASPEHLAHLAALGPLLGGRQLAVDVGTGDGLTLDVLAPLYSRVIAVERSRAQLARVAERVAARGFHHVSLFSGSYEDAALVERVDSAGGADLVFAGRTLHHASRPVQAVAAFARLLKKGGFLVVLDYLPHDDDALRSESGDAWLGFPVDDVRRFLAEAGLTVLADVPIPDAFHPQGPDAKLTWHAWVAQRPPPS
ncbi:MAG: metalloregulator ArsR/SmtB family transcription factor [Myxococcales bacterium]|nr:metalloregulator ArsR/SmtB family transcription factor [Myxococcales bacterium]